jgi:hypothetical protein
MADNFRTGVVQLANANVLSGTVDPTAGGGVPAPLGSVYCRNVAAAGQVFLKTGAADTDWTAWSTGGGGGGDLVLVSEQTVAGAAVDRFTFGGLDGEADGVYEIAFHCKRALVGTNNNILVLPNGSTGGSQSGVITQWAALGAQTQIARDPAGTDARITASDGMTFSADADDVWGFVKIWAQRNAAGATQHNRSFTIRCGQSFFNGDQGYWQDSSTNITSIDLVTTDSVSGALLGWDIGSTAQLWKRPF